MRSDNCSPPADTRAPVYPAWVPDNAQSYLEHTHWGRPMRELARRRGGHASTILRHVRRLESKRDDPLIDEALLALASGYSNISDAADRNDTVMTNKSKTNQIASDCELEAEARRILRRLCETSAFLIVASSMEKAAVMRETTPGQPVRIATVDRHIVQAFALKDWIECYRKGKIASYRITTAGKAALKRLLAREKSAKSGIEGFAEAQSPFLEQHKTWAEREFGVAGSVRPKRMRYNLAESPVTALSRRKDGDGKPFLSPDQIKAGERLREDFEMAQMGARVAQNWERFLTPGRTSSFGDDHGPAQGPREARERVAQALKGLGPGLGDIALRCCCFLEGLETAEKRMGWSARSGKIVLRIALQRLKVHYETVHGTLSPMIG